MRRLCVGAVVLVLMSAAAAAAQSAGEPSLADIARQAEKAKPAVPKAKRTYTNADLSGGGLPPAPPAAGTAAAAPNGNQTPAAPAAQANGPAAGTAAVEVQNEEVWRRRADRLRDQVKTLQARLADLSSRPPNPNLTLQQRAEKEANGIRADFVQLRLQWTKLEQDAKAAKVNILWIEPTPAFPQ